MGTLQHKFIPIFFAFFFSACSIFAQDRSLDIGLRFQKSINLYLENGITADYSCENLLSQKLHFGFSYFTSRLGTAIGSNALKQDNFLLSPSWHFRSGRFIRPLAKVNVGYFLADYETDIFEDLPNSSILFSLEGGLAIYLKSPLKFSLGLGYNLITGNGIKGPGTIYPLFVQTSATWDVLKKKKIDL